MKNKKVEETTTQQEDGNKEAVKTAEELYFMYRNNVK